MAWQCACFLESSTLIRAKRNKLQGDRQSAFQGILRTELRPDYIVEVDAASLQLCTNLIINSVGRSVFNFMAQFEKKSQIVLGTLLYWAARMF